MDSRNNLTTALLTEAQEWQDVEQMRRTVDAALLAVLEEASATDGASQLQVEAMEDAQSLSLTERQLQQYRTRMAAAQERLAERERNLRTAQERVLALDEIVPGEIDPAKKADLASLVPHARMTEDQALSEWQIARRETIAYAGITAIEPKVEQLRNGDLRIGFTVHYRSPDTDSCMEVYLNGVRVNETYLQHPAGEPDGEFWFNAAEGIGSGELEFKYSSGSGRVFKQVDSAIASYNTRESPQNAAHVRTTFNNVESHDTGRLVHTPVLYELKIMSTNGPSAVLHFTSPDDESVIVSSTGGLYGRELHSHTGGTSTGVSLVTLNPTKIGCYSFLLLDQRGTPRCSIDTDWDGTTLSPVNQDDQWTSEAASNARTASLAANNPDASPALRIATSLSEEAAETLEQERLELLLAQEMSLTNGITISSMNRELAQIQAKDLYWNSSLFLSMEKMHEYFFAVHPDWRPENFQATVMRMWEEGGRNGPSGNTRDWLNGVILDQLGRYDRDLGVYDAAMGEILQKGIDACLKIRQGAPEGPLFREIDELVVGRGYWEAVGRLKGIGVTLPDRHQVIAEASRIIENRIDALVFRQSEDVRLRANFDLRQENAQWMADHGGHANVTVLAQRKTVAQGYTQKEVSESERRRLDRAARLYGEAKGYNSNSRIQVVVAAENEPNLQRERELANGTTQITITTAEADTIATEFEKVSQETDGNAMAVGEVLVASLHPASGEEVAGTIVEQIGEVPAGNARGTVTLKPEAGKEVSSTFTLLEKKMVNLWMEPGQPYYGGIRSSLPSNYSLILSGTTAEGQPVGPYTSGKSVSSAESVSLALPAGTYTVTVRDDSTYECAPYAASVQYEMKPHRTQKIEGMVSIEGRNEAMPVSLAVAEFEELADGSWRRKDTEEVHPLNKNNPVWVVVHGRINSENSDAIVELARSLSLLSIQIVTVDWSAGARDNTPEWIGLQGADWTPAVGKWIARQLQAIGFSGDRIDIVGPSWGSYIAYSAARELGEVNSIVALDSACNDLVMNGVRSSDIDFRSVSKISFAIESSPIGSNARAASADYAFTVASSLLDRASVDLKAHNFAVTTYSALVEDAIVRGAPGQSLFDPRTLVAGGAPSITTAAGEEVTPAQDAYSLLTLEQEYWGSGWEGRIKVDMYKTTDSAGDDWWKALPQAVEFCDGSGRTRMQLVNLLRDSVLRNP